MSDKPQYNGTLRKGYAPNTIEGELIDSWGWRIHIVGTLQPDKTYKLVATVGDKGTLRIPLVDC